MNLIIDCNSAITESRDGKIRATLQTINMDNLNTYEVYECINQDKFMEYCGANETIANLKSRIVTLQEHKESLQIQSVGYRSEISNLNGHIL